MDDVVHILIEAGPETGRKLTIPVDGARIGRSSRNDVSLDDPSMSRYHCRFMFKDGTLHVADLGSANQTLLNGKSVTEAALKEGDVLTLGDSVLRVKTASLTGSSEVVDLGFTPEPATVSEKPARIARRSLMALAGLVLLAALVIWTPKLLPEATPTEPADPSPQPTAPQPVELEYEKVEATVDNIFRYHLVLTADNRLSVQIDDLANDRHVRKESELDPEYAHSVARSVAETGFFSLAAQYEGIQPDVHDSWDLAVTIGPRTHRVRVINRVEPDAFRRAREIVEECGKNELGLWAIQFSPEKLRAMAADAYVEGKRLYDQRDVEVGNLAKSIRSFDESQWYLETVEPKPDYYAEMLTAASGAREELDRRYKDRLFLAERSIRHKDWEVAADELRLICDMIPDRSDERNAKARRKLLDIENRLRLES